MDVAAGKLAGLLGLAAVADIVIVQQLLGEGLGALAVQKTVLGQLRLVLMGHDGGLRQRGLLGAAPEVAVLGNAGAAGAADVSHAAARHVLALQHHLAGGGGQQACQALDQLRLAVAGHAGDAHDLTGVHMDAEVVQNVFLVGAGQHQVPHIQHGAGGLLGRHFPLHDVAAHHEEGHLLNGGLALGHLLDVLAQPHDHDPVRHGHDLVELVGDDDDALAHLGQLAHGEEELVYFLGGQHGGGLVKDDDVRVLVQDLQDLHPLLQSNGAVLHQPPGVDVEAVLVAQLLRDADGGVPVEKEAVFPGLPAVDDVLRHGAGLQQHEVLLHHADLLGDGVVRGAEVLQLAVEVDLAGGGLLQSVEDLHQGGFAGAVFAHDC